MNDLSRPVFQGIENVDVRMELLPLDALPGKLAPALNYWTALKPDGAIGPNWRSFELLELPLTFLSTAVVVDYFPESGGYRYRYWGSALTPVFGGDLTGKTFEDCPGAFGDVSYKTYDVVRTQKQPCLIKFHATVNGAATPFQTAFRLPLSEDGATVSTIVSLVLLEYRKDEWDRLWRQ